MSEKVKLSGNSILIIGLMVLSLTGSIIFFIRTTVNPSFVIVGGLGLVVTALFGFLLWLIQKKEKEKKQAQVKRLKGRSKQKEKSIHKEISAEKRSKSLKKIIKFYTKIPLDSMAQLLEFNNTIELQKWIMDLPDELALTIDGTDVLIPATLKNDQSITKMTDNIASYFHTCHYCAEPLEKGIETCPQCHKEVMKCVVCKLNINFGDSVGKCSLCEAVGHLPHLQEWLKVNGKCPHCQQQLPLEGIVILERQEVKKKK